MPPKQLRRPNSLVLYWEDGRLVCEDYLRRERFAVSPAAVELLDRFGTPRNPNGLGAEPETRRAIRLLLRQGLLQPMESGTEKSLNAWRWGSAARHFFFSTKAANTHLSLPRRMAYAKRLLKSSRQPPLYKEYRGHKQVVLSKGVPLSSPVGPLLATIRDVRRFDLRPIPKAWLSEILLLACGEQGRIQEKPWGDLLLKTYHSAGCRHPIEVYPVVVSVEDVEPGLYHYNVRKHSLELVKRGAFSAEARRIANSQTWVKNAAVYLLLTAVFERTSFKYRHDSFLRSVFMDAGHMSQSVYLASRSLGLGACATHALRHDLAEKFIGVDGVAESFIFLLMLGWPKSVDQEALISPYRNIRR